MPNEERKREELVQKCSDFCMLTHYYCIFDVFRLMYSNFQIVLGFFCHMMFLTRLTIVMTQMWHVDRKSHTKKQTKNMFRNAVIFAF